MKQPDEQSVIDAFSEFECDVSQVVCYGDRHFWDTMQAIHGPVKCELVPEKQKQMDPLLQVLIGLVVGLSILLIVAIVASFRGAILF